MATSTVQPSSNTDFSQTIDSENGSNHLRVASFSTYLNPTEENFVLKLAESFRKPSPSFNLTDGTGLGRIKTAGEGEIRVFDAERYFKMKIGDESPTFTDSSSGKLWLEKNEDRVDLQQMRSKNRPGTPSASSESSWNSHSALFSSFVKNQSHKQRKAIGNKFFTGFACRGTCSDGKSVYVDKNAARGEGHGKQFTKNATQIDQNPVMFDKTKQSERGFQGKDEINCRSFEKRGLGFKREEKFAFPVLNSGLKPLTVKRQLEQEKPEEARDSIEVFGSHMMNKGDIAQNLERKLSVLTWDAIPQAQNLKSTNSRSSEMCEDVESDDSSDLFEIENISGSGSVKQLFTRQSSDGMSSCIMTPTTLYAPSEASIEWSVVTASAADFSAVSDCDELRMTGSNATSKTKSVNLGKSEAQKSRPGGLLGCTSHKAVKVVEPAYKTNHKSGPFTGVGKIQAGTKVKDFEFFPQAQRAIASRAVSSSPSAHASLSLYMQ